MSDLPNLTLKCLALPAAIIGGIQAAVWLVLSLITILYHNNQIEIGSTVEHSYGQIIYRLYLQPNETSDYLINSKSFNIAMYFYMVLSFLWLIISIALLWVTVRKKWKKVSKLIVCWSTITIIIAILDVTMMSLLAADFHKSQLLSSDYSSSTLIPDTQTVGTAIVIVMSVAARGYILLVLNITIAIILILSLHKKMQNASPSMKRPVIDAYANSAKPLSIYDLVQIDNSFQNEGFETDEYVFSPGGNNSTRGKNPLSQSNRSSFRNPPTNPHPFQKSGPLRFHSVPIDKIAKIGKAIGRKSPSRRIPSPTVPTMGMPYIPEPDYSPPSSPELQPKSVLRPKSNYVL